jgi:hypothetical protein
MRTYVLCGQGDSAKSREPLAKTGFSVPLWLADDDQERVKMSVGVALVSMVTPAAFRALPTQLDLFTAIVGGGAVGGIVGGAVAWLLDKDLAQGGILGGVLGMILGALLTILQSSGLYS